MPKKQIREVGHIISYFSGVAKIQGLPTVFLHEILLNKTGEPVALVIGFDEDFVEAIFFRENFDFKEEIFRSYNPASIPATEDYVGRIVDGLGRPYDNLGGIEAKKAIPLFRQAPPIIERQPVSFPLSTGVKIIDTTLPLGRGQRELIIGDRKLGKSTLAIDALLNQKNAEVPIYCIYVLCGQKRKKLDELVELFYKHNAFLYSTIVVALADDSFALQYLAPFVGCAIGEHLRDKGKNALIIYDDLSKHAKIYRDISLLLERAPGRETYPGDIFSLYAGLLERAAQLSEEKGGGSLTALPIIETQEGDISSFIPTNLISITDGQIYLGKGLFQKGFLPAVDIGLSVSRVGGRAQPGPLREATAGIRLTLAQHKELQKLVQIETTVSEQAQKNIHRGELILELLKQEKHSFVPWEEQVVLFFTVEEGFFDDIKKEDWNNFENVFLELIRNKYNRVLQKIKNGKFDSPVKNKLKEIATDFKKEFLA